MPKRSEKRGVNDLFARADAHHRAHARDPRPADVRPRAAAARRPRASASRIQGGARAAAAHVGRRIRRAREREENAKRATCRRAIDERSAWEIFDNAAALRERISAELFRAPEQVQPEPEPAAETGETETPAQPAPVVQTLEPVPLEESRQRLNRYYRRAHLDPKYRGAYLNRSIARHAARTEELYDAAGEPAADIAGLYPEALADEVELLRELQAERSALEALHDGFMDAPGGVIRHRGKGLKRSDLPKAIEALDAELAGVQARLGAHDRRCRSAHLTAAKMLGDGWPEHLSGLLAMVHYADHCEANLLDAHGALRNVFAIVTVDGEVTKKEMKRLLAACEQT